MQSWLSLINQAISSVVRPPRRDYDPEQIPTSFSSTYGHSITRIPVTFESDSGYHLLGSVYHSSSPNNCPCVAYLHGNASSQLEGQFLIPNVCPYGICVLLFDFAGCGKSDGAYVSLGQTEAADLDAVLRTMKERFQTTQFILWGRSMGTAAALLSTNLSIAGLILDSAYTSVRGVCKGIAVQQGMPKWACRPAIWFLSLCVFDIIGIDIGKVKPKSGSIGVAKPPLVIGHASDDQFVSYHLGEKLFAGYSNPDKQFVELTNGHNGVRGAEWLRTCYTFIFSKLGIDAKGFRIMKLCGIQLKSDHFADVADMMKSARTKGDDGEGISAVMELNVIGGE
jgi:pimeloyl-ACP methyl ester carboxylesterase